MSFILNRRLFTDAAKKQILEDGDPGAAYLIGGEGTTLTDDEAKKYGLDESHRLKEKKVDDETETAEDADEPKAKAPAKSEHPNKGKK